MGTIEFKMPASQENAEEQERLLKPDHFFDLAAEQYGEEYAEQRRMLFEATIAKATNKLATDVQKSNLSDENKEIYLENLAGIQSNFYIDRFIPPGVGGYYSAGGEAGGYIGIPPMVALFSNQAQLLRIISHEMNHAVLETIDEGLTDWLSLEITGLDYEGVGYEKEVNEYEESFGHLDARQTLSLLDPDPELMAMKFILELGRHNDNLDPEQADLLVLKQSLEKQWYKLKQVFPAVLEKTENYYGGFQEFWNSNEQRLAMMFWGSPERMRGLES